MGINAYVSWLRSVLSPGRAKVAKLFISKVTYHSIPFSMAGPSSRMFIDNDLTRPNFLIDQGEYRGGKLECIWSGPEWGRIHSAALFQIDCETDDAGPSDALECFQDEEEVHRMMGFANVLLGRHLSQFLSHAGRLSYFAVGRCVACA
ncbi:hypothetical protein N7492_010121 [Penicillium capsulatum]|uniref:Uncharacterized protein n=1 Tax=Penicillium capsulatum TaxID=69766 RepID=A0A9W9HLT6_9EURO|nr:hypothetical protein N7492_010121 [Penicillium capsulatum]KAJ6112630.1 hypothetical protein N7512_007954 [Penicillium capsulatum]